MGRDRDATPHECYVSTVARLVADGDASVVDFKDPMYQEWVRLREAGYQGQSLPLGTLGRLTLTTPPPLKKSDAGQISAVARSLEDQEAGFDAALGQLAKAMAANGIAPPAGLPAPDEDDSLDWTTRSVSRSILATSPVRGRGSPSPSRRRSPSPKREQRELAAMRELEAARAERRRLSERSWERKAKQREQERQKRVEKRMAVAEERAAAAAKRRQEYAAQSGGEPEPQGPTWSENLQALLDSLKGELARGETPRQSVQVLGQMLDCGHIDSETHEKAAQKLQETLTPEAASELAAELSQSGRSSPQPGGSPPQASAQKLLGDLERSLRAEPRSIVWPERPGTEPAQPVTAPRAAARPHEALRGAVRSGPLLALEPLTAKFADTAEITLGLGPLLVGHRGDALILALRRAPKSKAGWEPLGLGEGIKMGRSARCSLRLRSFGEVQLLWLRTLDVDMLAGLSEMLAQGVLAGLARDGAEPDAAFRKQFRLSCAVAVTVESSGASVRLSPNGAAQEALGSQVKTAVCADAERKEAAAAKAAAERAAVAAAGAAEAEAKAKIPIQLREAAKEGQVDDYEVDKEKLMGIKSCLAEGIPVDGVDDKGYTALYNATMYQKPKAVAVLLEAVSRLPNSSWLITSF